MPQEDWELSSGLREEVTFDIHMAMFGFRANYNQGGSLLLILNGTDENGEVFEHICSIGNDWVSPDSKHAMHPNGKNRVNKSSRYGQWITACQAIPTLWAYLLNSPGPTDASIWENLRLHLKAQAISQTIRGESSTRDILLPDNFIGFLDASSAAFTLVQQPQTLVPHAPQQMAPVIPMQVPVVGQQVLQPAPVAVMTAPVPSAPVGATPEQMLAAAQQAAGVAVAESPLRTQLRGIAQQSADHSQFVALAFGVPGVVTDQALVQELMNPLDFYAKAKG